MLHHISLSLQVFLNVATGGFGTEMTTKTDEGMKNSLGGLAYAITGVCMHATAFPMRTRVHDWHLFAGRWHGVLALCHC